jgi:hypothetical protein
MNPTTDTEVVIRALTIVRETVVGSPVRASYGDIASMTQRELARRSAARRSAQVLYQGTPRIRNGASSLLRNKKIRDF